MERTAPHATKCRCVNCPGVAPERRSSCRKTNSSPAWKSAAPRPSVDRYKERLSTRMFRLRITQIDANRNRSNHIRVHSRAAFSAGMNPTLARGALKCLPSVVARAKSVSALFGAGFGETCLRLVGHVSRLIHSTRRQFGPGRRRRFFRSRCWF